MDEKSGKGKIQFFALKLTFLIVGLIGALIMTAVTVTGRTYSWMTINVFIYALGAALLFFPPSDFTPKRNPGVLFSSS